jgi:hypothetical protein
VRTAGGNRHAAATIRLTEPAVREHTEITAQVNEATAGKRAVTINHWLNAQSSLTKRGRQSKSGLNPPGREAADRADSEDRAIPMPLARRIIAQMHVNQRTFGATRFRIRQWASVPLNTDAMRGAENWRRPMSASTVQSRS